MSLFDIGKVNTVYMEKVTGPDDLNYGEYNDVRDRLKQKISDLEQKEALLQSLISRPSLYRAGLMEYQYTPNSNNAITSTSEFETRLTGLVPRTKEVYAVPAPGFPSGLNVNTGTATSNTIWVWLGYVLVENTGTHYFYVNSDDACDVFINNQLVASYYSEHSTENYGKSYNPGVYATANAYMSIKVRFHNKAGNGSVNIYWNNGLPTQTFSYIPVASYFHNANLIEYDMRKTERDTLISDRDIIRSYLMRIDQRIDMESRNSINKMIGKNFMSGKHSAKYLAGPPHNNTSARAVILNFTGANTNNAIPTSVPIEPFSDINGITKSMDVPNNINFYSPDVKYTFILKVRIEKITDNLRNIFYIGASANEFAPGVFILPSSTKFSIVHPSTTTESGILSTNFNSPVDVPFVLTVVVDKNRMIAYINGEYAHEEKLPYGESFVWSRGPVNASKRRLVFNTSEIAGSQTAIDGTIDVSGFEWFDEVFTPDRVYEKSKQTLSA
jgi:hypothetical protein